MSASRRSRSYYLWAPLGIGVAVAAAVVVLFVAGPPAQQAQAAAPLTPQAAVGFQTTEQLVLTVNLPAADKPQPAGTLRVELLDADGKLLDSGEQPAQAGDSKRFELLSPKGPADKGDAAACSFGKDKNGNALAGEGVAGQGTRDPRLSGGQEFYAGRPPPPSAARSTASSPFTRKPIPLAASVIIQLTGKDGKAIPVYEGKTGPDGVAEAQFNTPAVPAGSYKMQVVTKSALGEEKLERDVTVKTAPRVLLVTDKPLYQPGQLIHIPRWRHLQSFDLKPVAGIDLTFEVEDGKGNKVFKKEMKTSEFGVASARLPAWPMKVNSRATTTSAR